MCEDGKSALISMAERGAPISDELEERDPAVLDEMVRNLQIRMIGMEREVQRRRSESPARKTNKEDATEAKGTGDMAGRPRDENLAANERPPCSFKGYLDQFHARRNVGENLMPDVVRMPERKLLKFHIKPFDGTEKYPGLGADFQRWGQQFLDEVQWAEIYSGFRWSDDIKLRVFRTKLDGMAARVFEDSAEIWLGRSAR
jgi:hypothetical protein